MNFTKTNSPIITISIFAAVSLALLGLGTFISIRHNVLVRQEQAEEQTHLRQLLEIAQKQKQDRAVAQQYAMSAPMVLTRSSPMGNGAVANPSLSQPQTSRLRFEQYSQRLPKPYFANNIIAVYRDNDQLIWQEHDAAKALYTSAADSPSVSVIRDTATGIQSHIQYVQNIMASGKTDPQEAIQYNQALSDMQNWYSQVSQMQPKKLPVYENPM